MNENNIVSIDAVIDRIKNCGYIDCDEHSGYMEDYEYDNIMYYLGKYKDLQSKIDKANEILDTLCVVKPFESVNGEFHKYYRPIKNTTKQETYKAICELKDILKEQ